MQFQTLSNIALASLFIFTPACDKGEKGSDSDGRTSSSSAEESSGTLPTTSAGEGETGSGEICDPEECPEDDSLCKCHAEECQCLTDFSDPNEPPDPCECFNELLQCYTMNNLPQEELDMMCEEESTGEDPNDVCPKLSPDEAADVQYGHAACAELTDFFNKARVPTCDGLKALEMGQKIDNDQNLCQANSERFQPGCHQQFNCPPYNFDCQQCDPGDSTFLQYSPSDGDSGDSTPDPDDGYDTTSTSISTSGDQGGDSGGTGGELPNE